VTERLGGSAHADRSIRRALAVWPRLLDVHLAAAYLSVGESTIRDYIRDSILHSVEMPGSTLRDRSGRVIAHSKNRRISKILIDRQDLDKLIDEGKCLP
jgi:hypothetical protein